MGVSAVVKDGVIQETASQSSVQKATEGGSKNGMDKDAFLQLLVAQMKYQDPLEPTSNTEYISQYATFSQVEQMQNLAASMELYRASSMVGKLVNIETTDSTGESKQLQGTVEYVTYENNKAYVSIDGELYSVDDVIAVVDETYQTAIDLAQAFVDAMDELPNEYELTLEHKETVETLQKAFNNMTAYQQSFIPKSYIEKLQKLVEEMAKLTAAEEETKPDGDEDGGGETEKTEGTEETDAVTKTEA